jgi:osmotically inducible lipoprotein OsmB
MVFTKIAAALALTTTLSGCLSNDLDRASAGALGGAAIAAVTGGNAVTGAVIGGAAGALCDDAGLEICN